MSARTVYLGLGSNLAPRESHLVAGLQAVEEALVERREVHPVLVEIRQPLGLVPQDFHLTCI